MASRLLRNLLLPVLTLALLLLMVMLHITDIFSVQPKMPKFLSISPSVARPTTPKYFIEETMVDGHIRPLLNVSGYADLDDDLDNMRLDPIPFMSDFKNPCWYEPMPRSPLYKPDNILTRVFSGLKKHLQQSSLYYRREEQHWRIRCLPYYYIIGVSKCGSSDLNEIIAKHPDVVKPPKKEVTFWNRLRYTAPQLEQNPSILKRKDYLDTREIWPLAHYLDVYDWNAIEIESQHKSLNTTRGKKYYHHKITGDATPNYIWHFDGWRKVAANKDATEPKVILAQLLKELTPMARIIVMIRDPIKRLWSEYNYFKSGERKSPDLFHDFVIEAMQIWGDCLDSHTPKYCAYDELSNSQTFPVRLRLGLYYIFIKDWKEVFEDQFLLLRLEEYAISRSTVTDKIFDFLDLEKLPAEVVDDARVKNSNHKSSKTTMRQDTAALLAEFYRPYNNKLAELMNDGQFNYNVI